MKRVLFSLLTLILVLSPAVAAFTGVTDWVSVSPTGSMGWQPAISADGRFVAFASLGGLVPEDTNGTWDVYLKDRVDGTLWWASTGLTDPANGALDPAISGDGRFVAFTSSLGHPGGSNDVYVWDRATGITVKASVPMSGGSTNGGSFKPSLSGDGRFVAFYSWATNLTTGDLDNNPDIYVRDLVAGSTVLASGALDGFGCWDPSISENGRYVTFYWDMYGTNQVMIRDLWTDAMTMVSRATDGKPGNGGSSSPRISPDGRYVAFTSAATDLIKGDSTDTWADTYLFDRDADGNGILDEKGPRATSMVKVSVATGGGAANAESYLPAVSRGGRYVAFESRATNLVTNDANGGFADVFVRDMVTGQTVLVSLSTSGQQGNENSGAPAISQDGAVVAFYSTATNLAPGDTNGLADVFVHY